MFLMQTVVFQDLSANTTESRRAIPTDLLSAKDCKLIHGIGKFTSAPESRAVGKEVDVVTLPPNSTVKTYSGNLNQTDLDDLMTLPGCETNPEDSDSTCNVFTAAVLTMEGAHDLIY